MSRQSESPRPLSEIEAFDPTPSIRAAIALLRTAGVPHALAGRVGVWAWLPADRQEFTKDVDFAVPRADIARLERAAREAGYQPEPLSIGGFGIRRGDVRVDFIDRHVDFEALFTDAVEESARRETATRTADGQVIPVVPVEHLIAMKLATGETKDQADVRSLLRAAAAPYTEVRRIVRQHLGPAMVNLLDRMAAEEGVGDAQRYVSAASGDG